MTTPWAPVSVVLGVMAIIPLFWIYFVPAIGALVCGEVARRVIRDHPDTRKGLGLARAGIGLGATALVLGLVVVVLLATGTWHWPSTTH